MTLADEPGDDLSVRLNWPIDPLAPEEAPPVDPELDLEAALTDLESSAAVDLEQIDDADAAVDLLAARLEKVTAEIARVLRALNGTIRRTRDQNIAALDERVAALREDIAALVETHRGQRSMFGDDLAAELKAWRRRLPTKGPSGGEISEPAMEELVNRLADELEIRLFAALKKSGTTKKR